MPKLLLWVSVTECLVDLIPLTLVTDQGSGVGFLLQDPADHGGIPEILFQNLLLIFWHPFPYQLQLHLRRGLMVLLVQHSGNGLESHAADIAGIDQVDCVCRLRDNDNLVCVLVFEISEWWCDDDTAFLLLPVTCADTAAAISGIEVVYRSFESNDQVIIFVEGVDTFRGGKYTHIIFPQVVDEQCSLGSVPSQPGQVFDHNGIDLPCIHHLINFGYAIPFKVHTTDIVIEGFPDDFVPIADRIAFNDTALIAERIEFVILVTGQAVVQLYERSINFAIQFS